MKTSWLASCALGSLLVLGLSSTPSSGGAWTARHDTPVGQSMDALKTHLKALARSAGDPAQEAQALEALSAMQAAVLAGKIHDPQNLLERPEAERDAHRKAFRAEMLLLLKDLADLEIALLEGRRDDVQAALKGPLMERRNAAHDRFQSKH